MDEIIKLSIGQFSLIYLLLIIILLVMKKCKIKQSKLLFVGSIRMTVQLTLAGFILTYIFQNPHPLFTIGYVFLMAGFASYTVLSRNKNLNKKFKIIVVLSLGVAGLCISAFFVSAVVGMSFFNPQYTIPISGMVFGNAMNGTSLALKTFNENVKNSRNKINTFINLGVKPQKILMPFVNSSIETALLPTINTMVSMGVISLPGMMTGQILSGTIPTTAIMYQIAIIIAISAVTCLSVFSSLYFGSKTLYNKRNQMNL